MRKRPAIERTSASAVNNVTGRVTVLVVSPLDEDHLSFQAIVGHPEYASWMVFDAGDLVSALVLLERHEIGVVVCEGALWQEVLRHLNARANAPSLIVTSRVADWHLWSEALTLGAWDVLAKPLDLAEMIRSVQSAWQHWDDQIHMLPRTKKLSAAS
jgi:DNA-binding NtrC family response regulator